MRKMYKNNKSGHKGISWHKRDRLWQVRIYLNNKQKYIGWFKKLEDAIKALNQADKL